MPLFFFSCLGSPPDLHSFPTRRSSDLPSIGRNPSPDLLRKSTSPDGRGATEFAALSDSNFMSQTQADRKSTRLNSSHRCISYAVFCLKKKSTHQTTTESTHQ